MYSIGLDYGTNSCRCLILDLESGNELASAVFPYPSGQMGILTDPADPNLARQNPQDYLDGCEFIVVNAIKAASTADPNFSPDKIVGIGVDTTGSTVIPVDQAGNPLAFQPAFQNNFNAQVWLWKDHTSYQEAEQITALAKSKRPQYLEKCGGTYSSEWWWAKILHLKNCDPQIFNASFSFVEHCDWLTAELSGDTNPLTLKRSVCAAGHKAMFNPDWGGLPDEEFLSQLDPALGSLRARLFDTAYAADQQAGTLSDAWAKRLGLKPGIAVAVGAFDCHMGAVAAGVGKGILVKVLGTSTCDITLADNEVANIPGLCGQVDSSVVPGFVGVEAGQSAVGDLFLWLANHLVPQSYGNNLEEMFTSMGEKIAQLTPGETGLLVLDWNNGNRSVLTDARLSGLILGQTLHTEAHEIYRATIEATAFGALTIILRMEEHGVEIREVVNIGGLSLKNPTLMQIYADVLNKPMKVSGVEQTCAMGAALFGAVAADYSDLQTLQSRSVRFDETVYIPNAENHAIYQHLYRLYQDLHDAFGGTGFTGSLGHVMKEVLDIRESQRKSH